MSVQTSKNQSLLEDAFEVLMRSLGPQKTAQLWQILIPPKTLYTDIRQRIFQGEKLDSIYKKAKRFNRK